MSQKELEDTFGDGGADPMHFHAADGRLGYFSGRAASRRPSAVGFLLVCGLTFFTIIFFIVSASGAGPRRRAPEAQRGIFFTQRAAICLHKRAAYDFVPVPLKCTCMSRRLQGIVVIPTAKLGAR